MQELTAVGIEPNGRYLICQQINSSHNESDVATFRLRIDDHLRSLLKQNSAGHTMGSLSSPALKPRDIQARIRAGASVEQIAAIAGIDINRVQRFANPVLLERARVAELAGAAPVVLHGTTLPSLAEIVRTALIERDLNPDGVHWDAWRIHDGRWEIQLRWEYDGNIQIAHFHFFPGSHGGTVNPVDDNAIQLVSHHNNQQLCHPSGSVVQVQFPQVSQPLSHPDITHQSSSSAEREECSSQKQKSRRSKPQIPAWEDVLLGVRSSTQR